MNIQIALDYVGYKIRYNSDLLFEGLYMDIIGVILKKFLYSGIDLDEGYIVKDSKKRICVVAGLENPNDIVFMDKIVNNYKKLDDRLKKYFKLDPNDFIYRDNKDMYVKLEFTGIDSEKDMIYLDTVKKLVEER